MHDLTATDFNNAQPALRRLAVAHFGDLPFVWLILSTTPLGYHLASVTLEGMVGHTRQSRRWLADGRCLFAGWARQHQECATVALDGEDDEHERRLEALAS